ncbi:MAG: DNA helicase RecQ [Desulfatirhabdiaceae bacterium]|nr:DNA helicase RecQ [Desulfatirhabdiaceae bacterium]
MIQQAKAILKNTFGYDDFRPLQQEIIENILGRKDTLVIMPTGGGKSLCYQIPALMFEELTVVVSPLISLMKDQVEQLTALGVGAVVLNSTLSFEEYGQNVSRILRNDLRLLYLAPETLLMPKTLAMLSSRRVDCIAIDEAHCISEWGHDFRPEYRQMIEVRNQFPKAVCVALTATATPRVQKDIQHCLNFETSNAFIASFNRKNLFLQIVQKTSPVQQTIEFIKKFPNQPGIIYCLARKQVDDLTKTLTMAGFSVKPYHAGLPDGERRQNQERFIRDDVQIMTATIAFGMGINKPNIRFVLHYDLPQNIESYYQQIGRAGRDGLRAHCMLLFGYSDIHKIKYFINQKSDKEKRTAIMHLGALIGLAETGDCRRIPLLSYFGEKYAKTECSMCDNCTSAEQVLSDLSIPAQKFLSCVKRCDEMFGAEHIIDVLRGGKTQKVMKFSHQDLSTYGIGKEYSKQEWFYLSRQLLQKGVLIQDMDHGALKLTPKAWDVLRGKALFSGKMDAKPEVPSPVKVSQNGCDQPLFELLREKRKELADITNVPPYVIFPDKTLIEMAVYFPQSPESLLQLHGVGAIKSERYGQYFLEIISRYCTASHIAEKQKNIVNPEAVVLEKAAKRRHILIGEAYNFGKTVSELAADYNVKQSTIINHLYHFISEGNFLRPGDEFQALSALTSDQQTVVLETFDRLGTEQLKPVFDALYEKVCYDELYLLRLYYLVKGQGPGT